ncbi:MAG: ribosome-associated translation inhibitor RaiA [Candidatus Paceibacterota bacterium]|jgi:ribosomal subunit interface protein|nr:ribosome-associated translation inhibitor RaiA [Candidatus Pacearchaeota archaeon]
MKINIKTTNISLDEALRIWTEDKMNELGKFLGGFGPDDSPEKGLKVKGEIWVEIGKTTKHHLKGDVFRAEAQIYLPNKSIRSEVIHEDLRTAIVLARDELGNEIKKYRGRRIARARGWARKTKEWLRDSEVFLNDKKKKALKILGINKK